MTVPKLFLRMPLDGLPAFLARLAITAVRPAHFMHYRPGVLNAESLTIDGECF